MTSNRKHKLTWTLALVLLALQIQFCAGQTKHALLIGIGEYPSESGWNRIHGDNDMSIIRANLLGQGFSENNINILINSSATKNGILSALNSLCGQVCKNDVVYIHFSGHGQQMTDLDGDEDDGYDEAWIPYDACKSYQTGIYEGGNHLTDDELNGILTGIRVRVGAKGKIIVVADACHSGSGTRGLTSHDKDETFIRGTGEKFILPQDRPNVVRKQASVEWLFIAACKPYQTNYEYGAEDGTYYGALSFVIANDDRALMDIKYVDVLRDWDTELCKIVRYPQDMDNDGQPSRRSVYMF